MEDIRIRPASIDEVIKIGTKVLGADKIGSREYFEEQYMGKDKLVAVAYLGESPAGYAVWYDRYNDGSFYCLMTGVDPDFRRKGILKGLMAFGIALARNKGYKKIRTNVRNSDRGMLSYMTKYNFFITNVEHYPNIEDNDIEFEREI